MYKTLQRDLRGSSLTMATIVHHLSPAAPRRAGFASAIFEALRGATPNLRGNRSRINGDGRSADFASTRVHPVFE